MNTKSAATKALRELLGSGNELQQCLSAQALGRIGAKSTLRPLLALLKDEDEDVRSDAVEALGLLGDARAVPPLRAHYHRCASGEEKVAALEALGRLGGAQACDLLLHVAGHRDEDWDLDLEEDWDTYWDAQLISIEALGRLGDPRAVPVIAAALEDENGQELSGAALKALSLLGPAGRKALAARLTAGSAVERRKSAGLLARHPGAGTRNALRAALADADAGVRAAALAALAQAGAPLALAAAEPLLHDSSPEVRKEAVRALCLCPPPVPREAWAPLLNDPEAEVRREVVRALPTLMNGEALPAIIRALHDPSQEVVYTAIEGLEQMGGPESRDALRAWLRENEHASTVRVRAVQALAREADPQGSSHLLSLLADPDQAVSLAALEGLAGSMEGRATGFLATVVRGGMAASPGRESAAAADDAHEEPAREAEPTSAVAAKQVDSRAAERSTLAAITADAQAPAEPVAEDQPAKLTGEAARFLALAEERTRINEALLRPRRLAEHMHMRVQAARLLGGHSSPEGVEALVEALDVPEPILQAAAAEALGRISDGRATEPLLGLLDSPDRNVRLTAVRALAGMADADVMPALSRSWPDADPLVRRELIMALATGTGPDIVPILNAALDDPDCETVKTAAVALLRRGELPALPAILAALGRSPGYRWREIGGELAQAAPEESLRLLRAALADPAQSALHGLSIGLLQEMALHG